MFQQWLRIASRRPIVLRALKYGLVVGSILIAINHGPALSGGNVDATRLLQMILTMVVPYCVSTASSVGALLDIRGK